jgi:hypothetical protein
MPQPFSGGLALSAAIEQPPKQDPPTTLGQAVRMPAGVAEGRPRSFRPGAAPAYWIWQGPRGGWRLRTTTANAAHTFRGYIRGSTGKVMGMEPTRTEFRDRVWQLKNGAWAFSFRTAGHADGFTFTVNDGGCVELDLQLDGGPVKKRIIVGKAEKQPTSNRFQLCPR